MWVAPLYHNDLDMETAREQHDVYGDALGIICRTCKRKMQDAVSIVGIRYPDEFVVPDSFDHRTMQVAHDLLAAAFRFRTNTIQPSLPWSGHLETRRDRQERWLCWLQEEVNSWVYETRLIRLVLTIWRNQNTPQGYDAEDELQELLKLHLEDVPWLVP